MQGPMLCQSPACPTRVLMCTAAAAQRINATISAVLLLRQVRTA